MGSRYMIRRLLHILIVLIGVSFFTFLLLYISPGDPVRYMFAQTGSIPSEEVMDVTREQLGLKAPFLVQYQTWLGNILHGNFGASFSLKQPVADLMLDRLWPTIRLALNSLWMMLAMAIPLGILAAVKQDRWPDLLIRGYTFLGVSMPNFWVGMILLYLVGMKWKLVPVVTMDTGYKTVILPALTLAIAMSAKYARQVRAIVLEELNQDYVTAAGYAVLPSSLSYDYDSLDYKFSYNVEGAKKLLDDAGIVDSDGDGWRELNGEKITLEYITSANRCLGDFAEAVQVYLTEVGIEVQLTNTDSSTLWDQMLAGQYDLCASNWTTVATGDPTAFLLNWYGGVDGDNLYSAENAGGSNYCNYNSEAFNAAYEKFVASLDEKERADLVIEMEQILLDDAAILVHGYYSSSMISNVARVQNANIHTVDYYWLDNTIAPVK